MSMFRSRELFNEYQLSLKEHCIKMGRDLLFKLGPPQEDKNIFRENEVVNL
jgi:hypothetical protein